MSCPRCQGLMYLSTEQALFESVELWCCINCGCRVDKVILSNQLEATMKTTVAALLLWLLLALPALADTFPGGFLENQGGATRQRLTTAQIASFMPSTRTAFNFLPPYNTRGVRLTIPSDCGGQDCVDYVGYSYWMNINNHTADPTMLIFLGTTRSRGGQGVILLSYNKTTEAVTNLGPLFGPSDVWGTQTGEGWYWSYALPTKIYMVDNAHTQQKIMRLDALTKVFTTIFDLRGNFPGCTVSSCTNRIYQTHVNYNDTVWSMTVTDGSPTGFLGCLIYQPSAFPTTRWYPKVATEFDECSLDKSGRWTLSLENAGGGAEPTLNRFFDNTTGLETRVTGPNFTLGHNDSGYGYFVGNDNTNAAANAAIYWQLSPSLLRGPVIYFNPNFNINAMQHYAHSNAINGAAYPQQNVCGSDSSTNYAIQNEIVCTRMDTTYKQLVVGPVMTDPAASGGAWNNGAYGLQPKGNLDITGHYFIWTSNLGGTRLDAFLVKVPSDLLTVDVTPPNAPTGVFIQ